MDAAKLDFTDAMSPIFENVNNDENDLKSKAIDLQNFVKTGFENIMRRLHMCKSCVDDHLADLDAHMENLLGQYKRMLAMKIKEDQLAVKCTMANAKEFYAGQMETALKSKPWYPADEFKKINDKALELTVDKYAKEAALSAEQAKLLHGSLQGLYRKFEDTNYSFIPTDSHAIGIDLGTTYSCVGAYMNGKVEIFQENEKSTVPSCVYFEEGHESRAIVGDAAQDGAFRSPENFIFDAKRLIGRNWDDKVVQDDIKHWNFEVVKVGDQPRIKCRAGVLRPEEVSAEVLAHLKALAEGHLGHRVTNAVVTVPAYFNEGQRQATKDAAAMAGLTATIMTEPVAAAVAYRLEHSGDSFEKMNVLVFDLGGGTFDVAILTISNWNIDVKTINGDTHLGGEDFDKLMVKHVMDKVKSNTGRDLLEGKRSCNLETVRKANNLLRRLKMECERKKRDLSTAKMVHICLEEVGWNLDETMTQEEFQELISPDLEKCMAIVDKALNDAQMSKDDIHDVILVGGSTKIPKVHELLTDYFNGMQLKHSIKGDQAVAYGAAIQAAIKSKSKQGNYLRNKITIQNVTPISIGIENIKGKFVVQVPKGSKIPFSHTRADWTNSGDYNDASAYWIYEGEEEVAKNNRFLGKFNLRHPPRKQGEVEMKTTTMVDEEGIVTVNAVCLIDGSENSILIDTYKGRMTAREIEERRVSSSFSDSNILQKDPLLDALKVFIWCFCRLQALSAVPEAIHSLSYLLSFAGLMECNSREIVKHHIAFKQFNVHPLDAKVTCMNKILIK